MKLDKKKLVSMAETYYRAGLAVVSYLVMNGESRPAKLAEGFIYGVVGVIFKAVNPKFKEYGIGSK